MASATKDVSIDQMRSSALGFLLKPTDPCRSFFQRSCRILEDSWRFLEIPGDSWRFLENVGRILALSSPKWDQDRTRIVLVSVGGCAGMPGIL